MSEWEHYAKQIQTLKGRPGFAGSTLTFLAYSVDLESGSVFDHLRNVHVAKPNVLYILLSHYANARFEVNLGKLVKFRDLPGGYAYERAFVNRAIVPITKVFGSDPNVLVQAAKALNGIKVG